MKMTFIFQECIDGEWIDRQNVTPELQILLKQRARDAETVGYPIEHIVTVLRWSAGETVWRAIYG